MVLPQINFISKLHVRHGCVILCLLAKESMVEVIVISRTFSEFF